MDTFGRRPLLIFSHLFMTVSLGAMGAFYFLKRQNDDTAPASLEWLPVTSLTVYILAFSWGSGPLTFTIRGEILPPEAKGKELNTIITNI